jgi:hypothetical protein
MSYESTVARVTREWMRQLDVEIGRRLTEIVGHTPSAEEVRQSGSCVVTRDYVRTYSWNGIPFLVVNPPFHSCNVETY